MWIPCLLLVSLYLPVVGADPCAGAKAGDPMAQERVPCMQLPQTDAWSSAAGQSQLFPTDV